MAPRFSLILAAAISMLANVASAELIPTGGTFTGYSFTDRWDQQVFDIFFVEPRAAKKLENNDWRPITLTTDDIRADDGGVGMIQHVEKVASIVDPDLKFTLILDKNSIPFGGETKLHVMVENTSDKPIKLDRRNIGLRITVHKRGLHPDRRVKRDEIYDCFNRSYRFNIPSERILRATMTTAMFTNTGMIQMRDGAPNVFIEREGEIKLAGLYDEDHPAIAAKSSREFVYSVGSGWLINEYELQIHYTLREKFLGLYYILSPPVSFDITFQQ